MGEKYAVNINYLCDKYDGVKEWKAATKSCIKLRLL